MKGIRPVSSSLVFALLVTIFCGVLRARPHLPDGLILDKPSVDLGRVVIGGSTVMSETVINPTNSDISIAAVSVDNANFQISGVSSPLVIAASQRVSIAISFTPTTAAAISGSLVFSLDGSTPDITVPLYGVGVGLGQLTASPANISFGSSGQQIVETLTNSGGTLLTVDAATVNGSGLILHGPPFPILLRPNQSASFNVSTPPSANGNASGTINVAAGVARWTSGQRGQQKYGTEKAFRISLAIPVSGAAAMGQLTPAPSNVRFGSAQLGSTQTLQALLTNSGNGPVTLTKATATGAGFGISGLPVPMTLIPGESATFSAVFTPQSVGNAQGNISIASDASNSTVTFALSGSGASLGQLTLSPANLKFGSVPVGKNQSLTGTLTANGSSVTVSSASVSAPEFSLSGIQLPFTIPAGQTASFTVTFAPQSAGTTSANIAFGSNASPATSLETASGAGAAPAIHNVGLSWTAGGSNVSGYNIYRGSQSGGPYTKINTAPNSANSYGDGAVSTGQTYFYVTTALDSSGGESLNSNEVQAVIP